MAGYRSAAQWLGTPDLHYQFINIVFKTGFKGFIVLLFIVLFDYIYRSDLEFLLLIYCSHIKLSDSGTELNTASWVNITSEKWAQVQGLNGA